MLIYNSNKNQLKIQNNNPITKNNTYLNSNCINIVIFDPRISSFFSNLIINIDATTKPSMKINEDSIINKFLLFDVMSITMPNKGYTKSK